MERNGNSNKKRLVRDDNGLTRPLSEGWHALDVILASLPPEGGVDDPSFLARLSTIREAFDRESDSSDTSDRIRDLMANTPPGLQKITDTMIQEDTLLYKQSGLRGLYDNRIAKSLFRGDPPDALRSWLQERLPHNPAACSRLLDLLTNGQRPFMLPSYTPNGGLLDGKPIENNSAYQTHKIVVEDNAAKMLNLGRAVVLEASAISPADMATLHVHTTFTVPKQGGLARVVTHCS